MSIKKSVILFSGYGSNLENLLLNKSQLDGKLDYIAAFTNNAKANGIKICKNHMLEITISNNNEFETDLKAFLEKYKPDLIILAGFMKIISKELVHDYIGKIINIHPSILPKYPGLNTYDKVLMNKDKFHGVTIHYVDNTLDGGPIILQAKFSIKNHITKSELELITHKVEHKIYPIVIQWFAEDLIEFDKNKIKFKDKVIESPITYLIDNEKL